MENLNRFFDEEAAVDGGAAEGARGFRLSAKALLLTYPRCPVDKESALDQLKTKFAPENVVFIIVGHELHEQAAEGEVRDHLHALVLLRSRCNIRNPAYLDLIAGERRYHGNYQSTRNIRNAIQYVTKDGDVVTFGEIPEHLLDPKKTRAEHLLNIEQLTSEQEFLRYVFLNGLSAAVQTLRPFWQISKRPRLTQSRFPLTSFVVPDILQDAVRGLDQDDRALLLLGPTGIGKTQLLLAMLEGTQLQRLTELDDLRAIGPETSHLLFDDVELERLGRGPLLHLLDVRTERSIKCRYSNATLLPTMNLILIGNSLENVLGRFSDDAAVLRRIRTLQLGPEQLFA